MDVGDEEQVKGRESKVDLVKRREQEELTAILKTRAGRDLLWRIMGYGGIFDGIITDPLETFRQLGRRDIGMMVMADVMEAYPEAYTIMRAEHPDEK